VTPSGYIAVAGGHVAVYDTGGSGPALMLVSGGPGWSCEAVFEGHLPLARRGRRVVAWDQLGCGQSDNPADPDLWTLERFAGEVEAVRAGLDLGDVHLLGQDWGAMLAVEAAFKHPTTLKSLVLLTAIGDAAAHLGEAERLRNDLEPQIVAMMKRREAEGTTDHPDYEAAMMEIFARHVCRLDPWPDAFRRAVESLNKPLYDHLQGPNEFRFTGALAGWSCLDRLGGLDLPACVMAGRLGWCTPHEAELLSEALPGSRLVVFEDSSHIPYFEEPLAYRDALSDFLAAWD
jgi:proline iminopeptidase